MFSKKPHLSKKSEDVKRSAGKVVDPKRDTQQRAKHLRIFLDNAELPEVISFFETYYSHIFYIVYDAFITAEINLRQKGAHKAQREELESVLYLFEKILIYLPEHLGRKWQYHSVGRLMSKLLHPGNSWKLLKREAMRLFLLWYQILGEVSGEPLHAMFATLVPGFPSPYQGLGLTALAAMTPVDTQDGPINPAEICPLIPPQSGERWRSPDTDLTRIFLDVLLELMVSQVTLVEWKEEKVERQKRCLNFLIEKFKTFYMGHIFPDFNWTMSLYRPALELPEVRKFRPAFVDTGDGSKKMDPMLTCRVVVIKWVAQYTHLTRSNNVGNNNNTLMSTANMSVSVSTGLNSNSEDASDAGDSAPPNLNNNHTQSLVYSATEEHARNTLEGQLVREILYGCRENVDFVHEVYRQAFLLSFSHSPAIKKVITVYKDWIQMNVNELPPFLLEPLNVDKEREDFRNVMQGKISTDSLDSHSRMLAQQQNMHIRAGLQNVLQIFVTNAANVFLLEVSSEYPILLEEQVEMCKRVLNIYRYMVMNVKMEARTWEQLLFILLQITQLTLPEAPPRKRGDTLGGRLAQAIFQTLIVTWIKANLYVVVSTELWDQFLEVLSGLTLWEELIKEWAKTMETLTRVLARQVYNLDLNDLPLDRLSERATKKRRGRQGPQETKFSNATTAVPAASNRAAEVAPAAAMPQMQQQPASAHSEAGSGAGSMVGPHSAGQEIARRGSPYGAHPHHVKQQQKGQHSHKSRKSRQKVSRSHSDSGISAKLSEWRREVLRVEQEFRLREFREQQDGGKPRKHRSLDSLGHLGHGPLGCGVGGRFSESDGKSSRSSSPAPSSGLECNSIKDSPLQLDHDAMSDGGMSDHLTSSHHSGGHGQHHHHHHGQHQQQQLQPHAAEPKSVMSGGSVKGWLPDVAVVLWRRMLGALGNINHIADTVIHAMIYKYLIELFDILVKIRANQGVAVDNTFTPTPPDYVPPFTIFAPWCFRALNLPETYQRGRLYALRLLCLLTCRQHDNPLPKTHLVQFYKVLHEGLTGQKSDVSNTLIRFTGPRFFSLMLPGYTAYILDFLSACSGVISSGELRGVPRTEATSVVGALLPFPSALDDGGVPVLVPNAREISLVSSADVKDQIIGVLLKSGKKEPAGLARCISLSSLGIFVYSELIHGSFHPKIKEAIQVLLTALRFNNKAVAQIASDMLMLLSDHVDKFLHFYPEVPKRIVEVLARTLLSLAPRAASAASESSSDDEKRLLLSLLTCLGEWCMRMPAYILTQPQEDGRSLLFHVFGALQGTCEPGSLTPSPVGPTSAATAEARRDGRHFEAFPPSTKQVYADVARAVLSPAVMVADFDPNIHVDNTKEGSYNNNNGGVGSGANSAAHSANASPLKQASAAQQQQQVVDSAAFAESVQQQLAQQQQQAPSRNLNLQVTRAQQQKQVDEEVAKSPIRLAARTLLSHLVNHLFHFPMGPTGASSLTSMVSEHDDLFGIIDAGNDASEAVNDSTASNANSNGDMTAEVFSAPNVQFFIVNGSTLLSFVELPSLEMPGHLSGLSSASSQVRVILRDVSGKFSWDCSALFGPADKAADNAMTDLEEDLADKFFPEDALRRMVQSRNKMASKASPTSAAESPSSNAALSASGKLVINLQVASPAARQAAILTRQRAEGVLPSHENDADDLDNLDDLLQYLTYTSPECLDEAGRPLNSVSESVPASAGMDGGEKDVIAGVLGQRNREQDQVQRRACDASSRATCCERSTTSRPRLSEAELDSLGMEVDDGSSQAAFQHCRRFFDQLGLASWERRPSVHLVKKNDKLLREIKNLDAKRCREAHKIAVIYVAEGQEDKQSILTNSSGSAAYEEFVSGLAWEVELETHAGFMGGLKRTRTTGETSPYYATSFVEVMFHVATRMPSNDDEDILGKTRHIGNDEIHIVWSEHGRDYRRGILPTEFCDVLIVIYPLPNRLFRVQVSRKPEVPFFGPLFNETIVDQMVLPGLVRATAINASRAKRSMLTYYQNHYEERSAALRNIAVAHRDPATFEDFITQVYSPAPLQNLYQYSNAGGGGGGSGGNRPVSLIASSSLGAQHISASSVLEHSNNQQQQQQQHYAQQHFSTSANELLLRPPASKKDAVAQSLSSPGAAPANQATFSAHQQHLDDKRSHLQQVSSTAGGARQQQQMSIREEPGLPNRHQQVASSPTSHQQQVPLLTRRR